MTSKLPAAIPLAHPIAIGANDGACRLRFSVWLSSSSEGGRERFRQLVDHGNAGLLGWLPGGFTAGITVYFAAAAIGALVVSWARGQAKAIGRRS